MFTPGQLPKTPTEHPHWMIANTTVRNPRRIPPMVEQLGRTGFRIGSGIPAENAFAHWLDDAQVVELKESTTDVSSIARKWRVALERLGLIYPGKHKHAFELSALGHRLANSPDSTRTRQVMRYAVSSYRVGLKFPDGVVVHLHPVSWTIAVLRALCDLQGIDYNEDPGVSSAEFALFIQYPPKDLDPVVRAHDILDFRDRRAKTRNKKVFERDFFFEARLHGDRKETQRRSQMGDYPDVSMRYLVASGLLSFKGVKAQRRAGIRLAKEHVTAADAVLETFPIQTSDGDYADHWDSEDIVIGSRDGLAGQYEELLAVAHDVGIEFTGPEDNASREELEWAIITLDRLVLARREKLWADDQHNRVPEILRGFRELGLSKNSEYEVIDADLKPSYLEWLLWRSVLALGKGSIDEPADARGFKIDDDILPIGFASGGRADLVFEFQDYVIVLEATLMAGSRQEAAEGEPVRRHVADVELELKKPASTLFIAENLDLNTIETFRLGRWYNSDEQLMRLDILPLTIEQFSWWFEQVTSEGKGPDALAQLVSDLRGVVEISAEAVAWRDRLRRELDRAYSLD